MTKNKQINKNEWLFSAETDRVEALIKIKKYRIELSVYKIHTNNHIFVVKYLRSDSSAYYWPAQ